ncbi:hypothetical protein K8P10_002412 [Leucobacter sp. Psy1]|nr:hypothetical protein K8P10_002412 [Leucobacter sp. Psy1]
MRLAAARARSTYAQIGQIAPGSAEPVEQQRPEREASGERASTIAGKTPSTDCCSIITLEQSAKGGEVAGAPR